MANADQNQCPICLGRVSVLTTPFSRYENRRVSRYTCSRCGTFDIFEIDVSAISGVISRLSQDKPWLRVLVSYWTRKAQSREPPLLQRNFIERVISEQHLPTAQEQADNLVQHIGEQLQSRQDPGGEAPFAPDELVATIGCFDRGGIWYLADELEKSGLLFFPLRRGVNEPMGPPVRVPPPSERYATIGSVRLTFEGWKRFSELQKAHSEGPIAFMAMPFGDPLLDRMFVSCFKPAIAETGFDLRRIIDNVPAGLIDDRLRVEIRKSRFMVCELTNKNAGAYWEGGFAEGLGRPVIYSCKKSYFQSQGTHFDTNHCHTILWDELNLSGAAEQLKATIRASLPAEAKLTD